jgi:hypothetical protein
MNDDELKREIEEALSVDPSPQFVARVRARIGGLKERSRTLAAWIRWGVAGTGLTVAAIVILVVGLRPAEIVVPQSVPMVQERITAMPAIAQAPAVARRSAPQRKTPTATAPEILIDPREMAAFRKFVDDVQESRIDVRQLIELQRKATESLTIEDIALMPLGKLEPIVIEPLTSGVHRIEGIEGGSL